MAKTASKEHKQAAAGLSSLSASLRARMLAAQATSKKSDDSAVVNAENRIAIAAESDIKNLDRLAKRFDSGYYTV